LIKYAVQTLSVTDEASGWEKQDFAYHSIGRDKFLPVNQGRWKKFSYRRKSKFFIVNQSKLNLLKVIKVAL
jgi:hypothetical protein